MTSYHLECKEDFMEKRNRVLSMVICFIMCILITFVALSIKNGLSHVDVFASQGNSNILFVGGTGLNNYSTIQGAVNDATNGYTIFVYNGVYNENLNVSTAINLVGENKDTTIIDGGFTGDVMCIFSDFVTVSGFTIRNSQYFLSGIQISNSNSIIIVKYNTINPIY